MRDETGCTGSHNIFTTNGAAVLDQNAPDIKLRHDELMLAKLRYEVAHTLHHDVDNSLAMVEADDDLLSDLAGEDALDAMPR